ncbi:MAG: TrmH family RNA methyltransferase, partial [Patescibacteria group bacterium]
MELITILHNVRSIHNVGSIFRTADAVGCSKIYLAGITPTPIDRFGLPNKALIKVALGAEKTVQWEQISSTLAVME